MRAVSVTHASTSRETAPFMSLRGICLLERDKNYPNLLVTYSCAHTRTRAHAMTTSWLLMGILIATTTGLETCDTCDLPLPELAHTNNTRNCVDAWRDTNNTWYTRIMPSFTQMQLIALTFTLPTTIYTGNLACDHPILKWMDEEIRMAPVSSVLNTDRAYCKLAREQQDCFLPEGYILPDMIYANEPSTSTTDFYFLVVAIVLFSLSVRLTWGRVIHGWS